jgi:hypothetical protein
MKFAMGRFMAELEREGFAFMLERVMTNWTQRET